MREPTRISSLSKTQLNLDFAGADQIGKTFDTVRMRTTRSVTEEGIPFEGKSSETSELNAIVRNLEANEQ